MKVSITQESKKSITAYQMTAAREIVAQLKEDEMSAADYAEYAVNAILNSTDTFLSEILTAKAEIMRNARAWNAYGDDTADVDVWISGIARTWNGFVEYGAYLTDIWSLASDNYDELAYHMYSVLYKRV